jgi:hypothetical protein
MRFLKILPYSLFFFILSLAPAYASPSIINSVMPTSVISLWSANYVLWLGIFSIGFWANLSWGYARLSSFLMIILSVFLSYFLLTTSISIPFISYLPLIGFIALGGLIALSITFSSWLELLALLFFGFCFLHGKIPTGLSFEQFWSFLLMKTIFLFGLYYAGAGFSHMVKTAFTDTTVKAYGFLLALLGLYKLFF